MTLPILYKRTSTGAINGWAIEVEDDKYRTTHGQLGGAEVTTEWTIAIPTNEGRANERSPEAQALFEAKAKWKKKKDSGCFEDIADIDNFVFTAPTLAKNWKDRKDKITYPIYCQPKFDGARCVISKEGAFSRTGKPWLSIPHILDALKPLFDKHPDLLLDGELYNHDLRDDFNKIMSLIKKQKPTDKDLEESKKVVQFHWYDICAKSPFLFDHRSSFITKLIGEFDLSKYCIPVETISCKSSEDLDEWYNLFLEQGYEGQMVRLNTPYEFKRSNNLLKRKEFIDKEYKVVEICEGRGNKSSMAGYVILERDDGVRFKSNIKGQRPYLIQLLIDKDKYPDKYGTCRFFELTPDGIPRFPYIYGFRDGVGVD
tara:strand:- start:124 stop:1236 length:1113 start_codon:yes stop_codon:yes gene_type:complete